jgi:hypothetical protein
MSHSVVDVAYLSIVLYAACDDWVDGELSLFVQSRCRHCICSIALSDGSIAVRLDVAEVIGRGTGDGSDG